MDERPHANINSGSAKSIHPSQSLRAYIMSDIQEITIIRPDDWHVHFRDEDMLKAVVPATASVFGRAIVMPNLVPPVTTVAAASAYRDRILAAVPDGVRFEPLMTAYLTDNISADELRAGFEAGVFAAAKLYPAGATTNSDAGVSDVANIMPVLEVMQEIGMPLLVHGEVTSPDIDIFDREAVFIDQILTPMAAHLPALKIVLEHATTKDAVDFVMSDGSGRIGATITAHHLIINRSDLFKGGIRPHLYCLPIAKRETHRQALRRAATSGDHRFFLGTDTAPHAKHLKEAACGCAGVYSAPTAMPVYAQVFEEEGALGQLEAFASLNGPQFYGLPVNEDKLTIRVAPWSVPEIYDGEGDAPLVPFWAGEESRWQVDGVT